MINKYRNCNVNYYWKIFSSDKKLLIDEVIEFNIIPFVSLVKEQ